MENTVRIDKWLWAVRIYKTRNQATEACKAGKVKWEEQNCKPSHEVKPGEIYTVQITPLTKTIRVLALLTNRVGAKLVPEYLEDLTPQAEYDKLKLPKETFFVLRDPRTGRPTKKERRDIEKLSSGL
ncbi:MAG: RNA-binding S4 domain-containing protein [Lentimicrobiaceae bacterium]|nr:RNA-binding S4 domain-containing protein [Lentimicrobiaceae bacterium]